MLTICLFFTYDSLTAVKTAVIFQFLESKQCTSKLLLTYIVFEIKNSFFEKWKYNIFLTYIKKL